MEIVRAPINGVLLIKPKIWGDARGFFVETWQRDRYAEAGVPTDFVQDNHSRSRKNILRGLHFQKKYPQGKLVSVSLGAVFDVVVDIRPESPTRGQWYGAILTDENQHQIWVPPGMAHGFCVLSDVAHFHYKCTEFYRPEDEGAIRWNDPDIAVAWPVTSPVVSAKDAAAPFWREINENMEKK